MNNKIPTTIFSGFLGSGKTTIISHLIDILQKNQEQVVYIKNEIGNEDIDAKVLNSRGIKTKELLNGCICCTLVGPFSSSVNEVVKSFKPDRILIEASGAADPSALALMISAHPLLERDAVVSIIDVINFTGYKDLSITAQNQTKFTDLIVFNKVEQANIEEKKTVVGYVRELNNHSPIIEAPKGKLDPKVIFGISTKELVSLLSQPHETNKNHIEQDKIEAFTLYSDNFFSQEAIQKFLYKLPKNIFRCKGFFTQPNSKILVFNTVGKKTTFIEAEKNLETNNNNSVFIFIGYHANEYQDEVNEQLLSLVK